MCFQSCDHLFRCLMSSVINKCMALISLCVAGAQELVRRWRDGGPVPAWRLLEMLIRAWGGGLWADALTLYCVQASMICFFHLNLLSCFSLSSPWPAEGLTVYLTVGRTRAKLLSFLFFFLTPCIIRSDMWNYPQFKETMKYFLIFFLTK